MKQFFRTKYKWQSVYYHFQKWCKDGSWEMVWNKALEKHKHLLDLSSIQLDGTHTPSKRGGDCYKNEIIANIDQNKRNGNATEYIFDDLLYKCRFVIERTNAWMDGFKALLVRFETNKIHWKDLNLLACTVILLRQL